MSDARILTRIVLLANRYFRYHVACYVLGNLALWGINRLISESWWVFWPLFVWSLLLALHYFVLRGFNADERWVEARARRLQARSYDRDHIMRIELSHRSGRMPGAHDLNWSEPVEQKDSGRNGG